MGEVRSLEEVLYMLIVGASISSHEPLVNHKKMREESLDTRNLDTFQTRLSVSIIYMGYCTVHFLRTPVKCPYFRLLSQTCYLIPWKDRGQNKTVL